MVPSHRDQRFGILSFAPLPLSFRCGPTDETAGVKWLFHINLLPQLECADTTGAVQCKCCGWVADLLRQDEDLHYEYTAEYEAGASHVVLEGWQCCGSILLRENKAKNGELGTTL